MVGMTRVIRYESRPVGNFEWREQKGVLTELAELLRRRVDSGSVTLNNGPGYGIEWRAVYVPCPTCGRP